MTSPRRLFPMLMLPVSVGAAWLHVAGTQRYVVMSVSKGWMCSSRVQRPTMCSSGDEEVSRGGPDMLLMASMTALRDKELERARILLAQAREMYEQTGGPSKDQLELMELIGARVDAAIAPGITRTTAARPPPPTKEELAERAKAKERGQRKLLQVISIFGDKSDCLLYTSPSPRDS